VTSEWLVNDLKKTCDQVGTTYLSVNWSALTAVGPPCISWVWGECRKSPHESDPTSLAPFDDFSISWSVRSWSLLHLVMFWFRVESSRGPTVGCLFSLLCIRLLYDSFVGCYGFYGYTRIHPLRSGIKKLLWGTLLYKKCSAPSSLPISIPIKEFRKTHVIHKDSHSLHLYRFEDSSRSCRMRCFWTDISTLLIIDLGRICIYHRSDFVLMEWCHCDFMDMGAPPVLQCF